jgi:hypothetical protein
MRASMHAAYGTTPSCAAVGMAEGKTAAFTSALTSLRSTNRPFRALAKLPSCETIDDLAGLQSRTAD